MNKAKLIAISAMCSCVVFGCLMLATLPGVRYLFLMLGVIASIATVIPIMLDVKNVVYSLLVYLVGSALGVWLGLANIMYVAPIVTFCIPFAIVKVYGESFKATAQVTQEEVLKDPFDMGCDQKAVHVQVDGKPRLNRVVRWVLYYVILEVALGLTVLATYLFTRSTFDTLVKSHVLWWVLGIMQLVVYPYNLLMRGCLIATTKVLKKAVKPQ